MTTPRSAAEDEQAWAAQSLDSGAAGTALLHVERARTGGGDWRAAHAWISRATAHELNGSPSAGLFLGVPAVAFVLHAAADPPERYQAARTALDKHVRNIAHQRACDGLARITSGRPTRFNEYDLLYGLTGIGALLLRTQPGSTALEHILTYLVALTRPLEHHEQRIPGWWVGHGPRLRGGTHDGPPHLNLGAAHGVTGPLLLLAQAARQGLTVVGHLDAIRTVHAWLRSWRQHGPAGVWWPETITATEITAGRPIQSHPGRPSWCYGTPGIARAGQLAALALGEEQQQHVWEQALADCAADPAQLRQVTDPGLCHGWAGLYQTLWRAAQDATTSDLHRALPALGERLRRHSADNHGDGFLNGRAGTALAEATHATNQPPATGWDACLLID
ncbi:lanthionine synthetase C family protein [Kitasatospora sp. NPDC001527]|uniref:lanthionine synthetase C family protein n=1 Tax=Kitasatospora sp. NPDC001527 TaxID=3154519 RepID=UPI00332D7F9D